MSRILVCSRLLFVLTSVAVIMAAACSNSTQPLPFPANGAPAFGRVHEARAVETVIYNFGTNNRDGQWPRAALINVNGTFYGTTYVGGTRIGHS